MSQARLSACMLISHKGHTDTIQVYSVTVMTHVKALQAGYSSQGTSEPTTPGPADHESHVMCVSSPSGERCGWTRNMRKGGRDRGRQREHVREESYRECGGLHI